MEVNGLRSTYFIGPTSGGLEADFQGEEIMVITPQSPLGQNLMGKKQGQQWKAKVGTSTAKYHILSVL